MAADPIPAANAATIPMGKAVSSAIAASAPTPTTPAPGIGTAGPGTGRP